MVSGGDNHKMNNQITLVGAISSEFTYDHSLYGEKYYRITLTVTRDSGTDDIIPVMVSERLINIGNYHVNDCIVVIGQYRSYSIHTEYKSKLVLFVFANSIETLNYSDNYNEAYLEGYITKPPTHRLTPNGREISDVMLGVPRAYNKSDYIPCIFWGRCAKYVSKLEVGDHIRVAGRVQSRNYDKGGDVMTAYEVSVNLVEVIDDNDDQDKIIDIRSITKEVACRG